LKIARTKAETPCGAFAAARRAALTRQANMGSNKMRLSQCKECGKPAGNFSQFNMDLGGPLCDECLRNLNARARSLWIRLSKPPAPSPTDLGNAAAEMLNALRFARDMAPTEWDALLAAECVGPRLCSAWDNLKAELKRSGYDQRQPEPSPAK
jgi:hypothetical protein